MGGFSGARCSVGVLLLLLLLMSSRGRACAVPALIIFVCPSWVPGCWSAEGSSVFILDCDAASDAFAFSASAAAMVASIAAPASASALAVRAAQVDDIRETQKKVLSDSERDALSMS